MNNDLKFYYFGRVSTVTGKQNPYGVTCVAASKPVNGEVTFSVAYCSPRDNFSKKKAREILLDRWNKNIRYTIKAEGMPVWAFLLNAAVFNPSMCNIKQPRWLAKHSSQHIQCGVQHEFYNYD